MQKFELKPKGKVWTLDHSLLHASTPLLTESFGDDPKWLSNFTQQAIEGASVAIVNKNLVVAACYTSELHFPCISAICVVPQARRQGWATQLLTHSLCRLQSCGARTVVAHIQESNLASTKTFQQIGFHRVDTTEQLLQLGRAAGGLKRNCIHYLPNGNTSAIQEACAEAGMRFLT